MNQLMDLFHAYTFEFLIFIGAVMISVKQPKRKKGWLYFGIGVAVSVGFTVLLAILRSNAADERGVSMLRYFGQFLITFGLVFSWLDCGPMTAVFVATTSYCMQQAANRLNGFIHELFHLQRGLTDVLVMLLCIALVYGMTAHFFYKRNRETGNHIEIANPLQLMIMTLALTVMIFIEELSYPMIRSVTDPWIKCANFVSSAVFALLILILEFNVLKKRDLEQELAITRRLLEEERRQYQKEKDVVEVINVKCHDLKHQLQNIGQTMPESEKEQIAQAVKQYDSRVRTGNHALDVVLTMKRMICEGADIEFSCMVNGTLLSFMEETDIYSLFGNLLDNAIEEVKDVDGDHRVVSLSVKCEKQFVMIHEENFLHKQPKLVDGIPQTTKPDVMNHGFGIRSMQMVSEKYNGHLMISIENGVFQLDIMLPLPKEKPAA